MMKYFLALTLLCLTSLTRAAPRPPELTYTITMDPVAAAHVFNVRLEVPKMDKAQAVYEFAATAPRHVPGNGHGPLRAPVRRLRC